MAKELENDIEIAAYIMKILLEDSIPQNELLPLKKIQGELTETEKSQLNSALEFLKKREYIFGEPPRLSQEGFKTIQQSRENNTRFYIKKGIF